MNTTTLHSRLSLTVSLAIALSLTPLASGFTPGGYDLVDAKAVFGLELDGLLSELTVAGPLQIERQDPMTGADGREEQTADITDIDLQGRSGDGSDLANDLFIALRLGQAAPGSFRQQQAGQDFPADSSFSFLLHVVVGGDRLIANRSVALTAVVNKILPLQSCYVPAEPFQSIPLLNDSNEQVGSLTSIELCFGEHPTFSLPSSNPSGFHGADLYDVPTTKRLDRAALGLTPDDDITSLSFGVDYVESYMDVRFSVDPNTVGQPGTKVNEEATKGPSEAHGDEFQVSPVVGVGAAANRVQYQILDENGDTAPPFPLMIGDDIVALTEHPASFVDPDGDGQLDRPVYFTLADGSATLGLINATPGDILVTDGSQVQVFMSHEQLMLPEFNYIDAICVDAIGGRVAYSLDPMSSLVSSRTRSAADVLSNIVPIPPGDFAFASFDAFGLIDDDNINALKCVLPEVDYYPNSVASINLNGEVVELTGYSRFVAGILGDGRTGPGTPADFASVMGDVSLSGTSTMGAVRLTLSSSAFGGRVLEPTDVRSGFLDMPPFTNEGTGRLEMSAGALVLTIGERLFFLPSGSTGIQFSVDVSRKPINAGEMLCAQEPFGLEESGAPSTMFVSSFCVTPEQAAEPKPEFGPNSLLGAASFGQAATGGLGSLFVGISDFVDATAVASTVPLSAQLAQTTVEFTPQGSSSAATKEQGAGVAAPLVFVSGPANQINLQIPWEIPPGIASVVVTAAGVASDPVNIAIAEFAPGIFSFDSGAGRAVAFFNDGTIIQPVGSFGLAARPAAIGEAFSVLATGMGPTAPPSVTGDSSSVGGTFVLRNTVAQPTVTIGGVPSQVFASILSPEFVGVYQVVVIPQAGTPAGDAVPIVIDIGGATSRADVTVAIAP